MEGQGVSQKPRALSSLLSLWICRAYQEGLKGNEALVEGRVLIGWTSQVEVVV